MATPCFADLGKQAKDLFNKNYHLGIVKLDFKTKTQNKVEFNVSGTSNTATGNIAANLESKHYLSDYGLTVKEKWTTDNVLSTELSVDDQFAKGLKLAFNGSFVPLSGKKNGTFKTSFKTDALHLNGDVDMEQSGFVLHGAGVFKFQSWLGGAQLSFDPSKSAIKKNNIAIGYQTPEFNWTTNLADGKEASSTVYQRVNDKLETGISLAWSTDSNATRFGLGCIYKLDNDTSVKAKVNNSGTIGLGLVHRLRSGILLTLCASIDGKNVSSGGHKLGMGLELAP
ncbi:voltage-dependent anion-selective channel protein 2-like [Panonychus citri]|uniref:voltage-dependent anion-selective channel protein 2-like n=1 Tax=Panonychus citri TaxID=50023 RepID=UPI002307F1A3|nr:voltage-dependent anion-selective channel protein 2-like [Panonychus citri]